MELIIKVQYENFFVKCIACDNKLRIDGRVNGNFRPINASSPRALS